MTDVKEKALPAGEFYVHCRECVEADEKMDMAAVVFDDLLFLICQKHSENPLLSVKTEHCITWQGGKATGRF